MSYEPIPDFDVDADPQVSGPREGVTNGSEQTYTLSGLPSAAEMPEDTYLVVQWYVNGSPARDAEYSDDLTEMTTEISEPEGPEREATVTAIVYVVREGESILTGGQQVGKDTLYVETK